MAAHHDELERHAESLAQGLGVVIERAHDAEPDDDAARNRHIGDAVDAHLHIHPPIRSVQIVHGHEAIRVVSAPSATPPPADGAPQVTVQRVVFGHTANDASQRPPPWEWSKERFPFAPPPQGRPPRGQPPHDGPPDGPPSSERPDRRPPPRGMPTPNDRADTRTDTAPTGGAYTVIIALDEGRPRHVTADERRRIGTVLLWVWAALGALVALWVRNERARALAVALSNERQKRKVLRDVNLAAAGMAHETKNPLGIIFGLAQRLADDERLPDDAREAAEHVMDAADRATARLSDYLNFARVRTPDVAPTRCRCCSSGSPSPWSLTSRPPTSQCTSTTALP